MTPVPTECGKLASFFGQIWKVFTINNTVMLLKQNHLTQKVKQKLTVKRLFHVEQFQPKAVGFLTCFRKL